VPAAHSLEVIRRLVQVPPSSSGNPHHLEQNTENYAITGRVTRGNIGRLVKSAAVKRATLYINNQPPLTPAMAIRRNITARAIGAVQFFIYPSR
jgi:hypothetical protein